VQAVCSGFVYALTVADAMIQSGAANRVLVVGSEVFSRILISTTAPPACCLATAPAPWCWRRRRARHSGQPARRRQPCGHSVRARQCLRRQVLGDPLLKMDGQAVFKLAVGVLEKAARATLDKAGLTEADIDWLIPHQANIRIMQSTAS
jgi:3-oxoacyl-[acyl-carrier-protein] synthase-3